MTGATDFIVTGGALEHVDIGASGLSEIIQNVRTILATWRGSVFLDRTFGISPDLIDAPQALAMARLRPEITDEIEKQEPRVQVTEIAFLPDENANAANGSIVPVVKLRIREGALL